MPVRCSVTGSLKNVHLLPRASLGDHRGDPGTVRPPGARLNADAYGASLDSIHRAGISGSPRALGGKRGTRQKNPDLLGEHRFRATMGPEPQQSHLCCVAQPTSGQAAPTQLKGNWGSVSTLPAPWAFSGAGEPCALQVRRRNPVLTLRSSREEEGTVFWVAPSTRCWV